MEVVKLFIEACKKLNLMVPYIKIEKDIYKYYLCGEKYKIEIDNNNQIKENVIQNLMEFSDELKILNNKIIDDIRNNQSLELYTITKDIYNLILENSKIPIPEDIEINKNDKSVKFIWDENTYITINDTNTQFQKINILEKYFNTYYLNKEIQLTQLIQSPPKKIKRNKK